MDTTTQYPIAVSLAPHQLAQYTDAEAISFEMPEKPKKSIRTMYRDRSPSTMYRKPPQVEANISNHGSKRNEWQKTENLSSSKFRSYRGVVNGIDSEQAWPMGRYNMLGCLRDDTCSDVPSAPTSARHAVLLKAGLNRNSAETFTFEGENMMKSVWIETGNGDRSRTSHGHGISIFAIGKPI